MFNDAGRSNVLVDLVGSINLARRKNAEI